MPKPIIELRDLHRSFGDNHVLTGVNLDIYPGQVTVILGKSGMGKSVMLKHIIGLIEPDSGQVLIEGKDIWQVRGRERRKLLGKISYLFQGTALFDSMDVYGNVSLPLHETSTMPEDEIRQRFERVINLLDLGDIAKQYPAQLSGGMRKRVALARALITQPEVLLFDEPTTGLDPVRKMSVLRMINDYHAKLGYTGVLVSHAIPDMLYISDRVAFLDEGKIIFQGTPAELLAAEIPVIREFFTGVDSSCVSMEFMNPGILQNETDAIPPSA
jgi:phospholipid/cholesterol/gamma-HCH transport system ATP-binding protein